MSRRGGLLKMGLSFFTGPISPMKYLYKCLHCGSFGHHWGMNN